MAFTTTTLHRYAYWAYYWSDALRDAGDEAANLGAYDALCGAAHDGWTRLAGSSPLETALQTVKAHDATRWTAVTLTMLALGFILATMWRQRRGD